jgi:hypothetical protein
MKDKPVMIMKKKGTIQSSLSWLGDIENATFEIIKAGVKKDKLSVFNIYY